MIVSEVDERKPESDSDYSTLERPHVVHNCATLEVRSSLGRTTSVARSLVYPYFIREGTVMSHYPLWLMYFL